MNNPILKTAAFLFAALFIGITAATCWIMITDPKGVDFISFWATGRMVVEGAAPQFYDLAAHTAVEKTAVPTVATHTFAYPPIFAMLLAPFGLPPFGIAFTAWLALTGIFFAWAARQWMVSRLAFAQPAVLVNGLIGQNAFLTTGLLLAGLRLISSRPLLAGAVLGLLIIKPQLALMLPVAMLAGGHWRTIAGAALSVTAALLIPLLLWGVEAYTAYFELLQTFAGFIAASRWPWHELASAFAFLRYLGVDAGPAMTIHVIIAISAAALVWRMWKKDRPGKEAVLAAATLLAPPYLLTYDAVFLALPVAWLLNEGKRPTVAILIWGLSLISVGALAGFYPAPNLISLASILAIAVIFVGQKETAAPRGTAVPVSG